MKPARIVLDLPIPLEKSWCWREDWVTGFDSAYGLLSKFAKLNAMGARELVEVFFDRGPFKNLGLSNDQRMDLRTGKFFNLIEMARVLRLTLEDMQQAFLLDSLPRRREMLSSGVLRWCPCCASAGFHSPLFQVDMIVACPAHGRTIRSRCPECRAQIPYWLRPDVFAHPFCCPSCNFDLAPALRDPKTRSLRMQDSETAWISDITRTCRFADEMLLAKIELDRERKLLGIGEVAFSSMEWRGIESEYIGFIMQVLNDFEVEPASVTRALPFAKVLVTVKGTVSLPEHPNAIRRRMNLPLRPLGELRPGGDYSINTTYLNYSGIRRHLWRHVLRQHQYCICTAGHHLWWDMEGEQTASFCPIAEAFLRWRMLWEGCRIPRSLFAPVGSWLGLTSFMNVRAPYFSRVKAAATGRWIVNHVLGRAYLGSFREFLDIALHDRKRDRIDWDGHALSGKFESYWAVAGRDTTECPLRIYEQVRADYQFSAVLEENLAGRAHRHEHLRGLACIRR